MIAPLYRQNACVFKEQSSPISDTLFDQGCTPTMPSPFLTLKQRARLTCFPDEIPQWDLITYFTLTEHDGALIATYLGDTNRLGAALQLCAVRYLGFCPTDLHTASAIPADGLIVNGLLALWPSMVLYDRSARHPIAYDSSCMRA